MDNRIKLLTDENIFTATVTFLRKMGFDLIDISELQLKGSEDDEIAALANKENRIILTFDKHFGNIIKFPIGCNPGVILVRINPLSIEMVNPRLEKILSEVRFEDISRSLVIIDNATCRIRRCSQPAP